MYVNAVSTTQWNVEDERKRAQDIKMKKKRGIYHLNFTAHQTWHSFYCFLLISVLSTFPHLQQSKAEWDLGSVQKTQLILLLGNKGSSLPRATHFAMVSAERSSGFFTLVSPAGHNSSTCQRVFHLNSGAHAKREPARGGGMKVAAENRRQTAGEQSMCVCIFTMSSEVHSHHPAVNPAVDDGLNRHTGAGSDVTNDVGGGGSHRLVTDSLSIHSRWKLPRREQSDLLHGAGAARDHGNRCSKFWKCSMWSKKQPKTCCTCKKRQWVKHSWQLFATQS